MLSVSALIIVILSFNYDYCWGSFKTSLGFRYDWIEKNIQQPVDHFDLNEKRTFKFTYFASPDNDQSLPNAPIFIWLKTSISDDDDKKFSEGSLLITQLAKEMNGSSFIADQRYETYNPLSILPHDKDYLKFLTTEQVLADFSYLIKKMKSQSHYQSSKVVLAGTIEGGRVATWMRMIYPELVDAVLASDAALLAKKELKEYFDEIHHAYEKYGTSDCLGKLEKYYHSIEELFKTKKGIETIQERFNICDDNSYFENEIDKQWFWDTELYHNSCSDLTFFGTSSHIKSFCTQIPNETIRFGSTKRFDDWCWSCNVNTLKLVSHHFAALYQQCSEYGQFRSTAASEKQPFVHWQPLDYFLQLCKFWYGIDEKRIDEGVAKTNEKFGGITPNVTNVVFTYGELNPYRLLGVQKNLSESVVSFVIEGAGAYSVPYIRPTDSKQINETRKSVVSLIKKWIAP